jgi:hypothetical protein
MERIQVLMAAIFEGGSPSTVAAINSKRSP